MDMNLKGKTALVTGAASGLGMAIAEELAREGVRVAVNYRSRETEALALVNRLNEQYGTGCILLKADMADNDQVETLFNDALEAFGNLDILVNNAGIWPTAYLEEITAVAFSKTLDINLVAPFILCSRMVTHLKQRQAGGKIINIVSQAAFNGSSTGHAHYAASKAGLVKFTVSMAREVAKHGICCNCIAPGMIYTPMTEKTFHEDARESYYESRIPLGRIAKPEEVAYTAVFLASDKSDYITGATIDVTGGMLMR